MRIDIIIIIIGLALMSFLETILAGVKGLLI